MPTRPSSRDRTRGELMRIIRVSGGATRAELVRSSGLSRSAVDGAVLRLLNEGKLIELDVEPKGRGTGSGRPAARLMATGDPVAGIDFGHNHVHVAVADPYGTVLGDRRIDVDVDLSANEAMDAAADLLQTLRAEHDVTRIESVVAGIPGPVDTRTGLVQSPTILSGWVGKSPAADLEHRIGVAVHIENDAALGAFGEFRRGAGRGHTDFIYVKASHGIGAGLVLDGKLFRGGTGLAGEIGHTHLNGHTELCRCGNRGCLETVVSVSALHDQIAHTHPSSDSAALLIDEQCDAVTRRLLDESGRKLGRVVSDMCNLVNPTAVIIGGELGAASDCFLGGVEQAVQRYAQAATAEALVVVNAELGTRSELIGAVELATRAPVGGAAAI